MTEASSTARIWRAGDAPLEPGTRVRALVVENVSAAVGKEGTVLEVGEVSGGDVDDDRPPYIDVQFDEAIGNDQGAPNFFWLVDEAEVIDDGGEQ